MKKWLIIVVPVVVVFAALLVVIRTVYPGNICETAPDHAEAALRTRRYQADLGTFAGEVARIIPTLTKYGSSWKLISSDVNDTSALIKAEVPVLVFTDDLVVKAQTDPATGELIVNVRSNSRVGKSDLGENRRHVLKLLTALDEKFR